MERLDQVIVGTGIEAAHAAIQRVARGHHEHRRLDVGAARLDQHVQAVLAGQAEVEQHQVGGLIAQRDQRLAAVAQPAHRIGEALQRALDRRAELRVVFHQDDVHE